MREGTLEDECPGNFWYQSSEVKDNPVNSCHLCPAPHQPHPARRVKLSAASSDRRRHLETRRVSSGLDLHELYFLPLSFSGPIDT